MERGITHVLEGMRSQRLSPQDGARRCRHTCHAYIEKHQPSVISANEGAPADHVVRRGSLVDMDRRSFARRNPGIQHPDPRVLKDQPVLGRGRAQRIQLHLFVT